MKAEPGEKPSIDGIWRTNNFALGPSGPKTNNGLFLKISRYTLLQRCFYKKCCWERNQFMGEVLQIGGCHIIDLFLSFFLPIFFWASISNVGKVQKNLLYMNFEHCHQSSCLSCWGAAAHFTYNSSWHGMHTPPPLLADAVLSGHGSGSLPNVHQQNSLLGSGRNWNALKIYSDPGSTTPVDL